MSCVCDVCTGTGKPVSGRPCICQGEGTCTAERVGLRNRVMKAEERLYQVARYAACLTGGDVACNCIICEIRQEIGTIIPR